MNPSPLPLLTAVLLAGGRSQRMGRDKAGLMIAGEPLWRRQIATLRAAGASEIFISGQPDGPYADAGVPIVLDDPPARGPLGGIVAALRHMRGERLLVLAIDLPRMRADFLTALARECEHSSAGVVPQNGGYFEPLAAVYPRACLPLAEATLRGEDWSMQRFVRAACDASLLAAWPIRDEHRAFFLNVNSPEGLRALGLSGEKRAANTRPL